MPDTARHPRKRKIECVIFDYGNVISTPQRHNCIRKMAASCGLKDERFQELYWQFRTSYDRGEIDGPSYWAAMVAAGKATAAPKQIRELIALDIESWMEIN